MYGGADAMDVNSVKERIRNLGPRHGLTMMGVAFLVSLIGFQKYLSLEDC